MSSYLGYRFPVQVLRKLRSQAASTTPTVTFPDDHCHALNRMTNRKHLVLLGPPPPVRSRPQVPWSLPHCSNEYFKTSVLPAPNLAFN